MVSPNDCADGSAHSNMDPNIQHQLHELVRLANIQMDGQLLGVILDLLRHGASPDSIYAFLVKASRLSRLGKRIREKEENEEKEKRQEKSQSVGDERRGQ